jgi:tRNA (cytidine/uridine-2'-O-)-methyltransferase
MFHVVLFQPEIPPNTGNVIRLCANTGCTLHLVRPLGFDIQGKAVRRAGLDYDELARVRVHASLDACLSELVDASIPGLSSVTSAPDPAAQPRSTAGRDSSPRLYCVETSGAVSYSDTAFGTGDVLIFGPETRGLPAAVLDRIPRECHLFIPMRPGNRSINLSNSVAIVVFEAWRQLGFSGTR